MTQTTFPEIWTERQENLPSLWDDQARQIIEALEALGIKKEDIDTNGYRFTFSYKNLVVEVFNHGKGVSGTIHKKPYTQLERACLDDADEIFGTPRFSLTDRIRFVKEFDYRKFSYDGKPAQVMASVIKCADTPVTSLPMDYIFNSG